MGLVSPNELLEAAQDEMLEGRKPQGKRDWEIILNFMAFNLHKDLGSAALRLMARMYQMPVSDKECDEIWNFQLSKR
jgi:hypothetical protein